MTKVYNFYKNANNIVRMANLVSVLLIIVGGLNWASIGFLQYDFIAGFFGSQASIFSRLIYIFIGLGTLYFIFMIFKYKGKVKIIDRTRGNNRSYDEKKELSSKDILN